MKYRFLILAAACLICLASGAWAGDAGGQIRVCATAPELASLASEIGGDQVSVTSFGKGMEDPHFVEAKPSFIKTLSQADLYIQIGLELEIGYGPLLLQGARNKAVLPGSKGFLEVSEVITPLEVPTGPVDRSMGDVHPGGNPHFMSDPLSGLKVAQLIRDRLTELRPRKKTYFDERFTAFRKKLGDLLVGEKLAAKYDFEKIALLQQRRKLGDFLKSQHDEALLGGWIGLMLPFTGAKIVDDHALWPYFANCVGIDIVGHMEPKPGIAPTTKHLGDLVKTMQGQGVKVIVTSAYFDPRHAQFLSEKTGAKVAKLAHQVGSLPGTDDYFSMIDYNVTTLATALKEAK